MDTATEQASESISTTCLLIYTVIALFVIRQLHTYSYFWRKGIPGPRPLPFLGNYVQLLGGGYINSVSKWTKKYGTNFGFFSGSTPTIVTADLDLARLILIKEFASFSARDNSKVKLRYISDGLQSQKGAAWKKARSYMSQVFSGSKMKEMIPSINDCCDILMDILDEKQKNGESFETKKIFSPFIMDCIASCAFGLQSDCQRNPDDAFLKHGEMCITGLSKRPGYFVAMIAPSLTPVMDFFGYEIMPRDSLDFFADVVKRAIELRKEGNMTKRKDFIQLMIEAGEEGQDNPDDGSMTKKKEPLTIDELIGQSFSFFFAGFSTIASTLGMVIYCLGKNPDVQKRLQEEIDEYIPEGEPVGYDAIFKMEYLDMVWNETNRILPIGAVLQRFCNKDLHYNGLNISAGNLVMVNGWTIHHDPEHWPEPDKFDPERFTKEAKESHHPLAFLPFGAGPRNCVGMRFAILECRAVLIRILQKYSFELTSETPDLSDLKNAGKVTLYPSQGIHFRVVPRN